MRSDPAVDDYRIDHTHGLVVESLSGDLHIDDDVAIGSHRVHSAPAFVRLRLAVRDLVRTDGVRHVDGDGQHLVETVLPGTRGGRDEVASPRELLPGLVMLPTLCAAQHAGLTRCPLLRTGRGWLPVVRCARSFHEPLGWRLRL